MEGPPSMASARKRRAKEKKIAKQKRIKQLKREKRPPEGGHVAGSGDGGFFSRLLRGRSTDTAREAQTSREPEFERSRKLARKAKAPGPAREGG